MSDTWCDQCDRYYDPSKEHDCRVMTPNEAQANRLPHAWRPAWKGAAEAGGTLPSADGGGQWTPDPQKPDHYTFGPLSAERAITLASAHIATLPTGELDALPAGTVLREAPTGSTQTGIDARTAAEMMRPLYEGAGLPREMAPSVEVPDEHGYLDGYPSTESPPANLDPTEREAPPPLPFAEAHETRAERVARLRDATNSPADPDPWLRGLTLAAYNAARAGLERGTSAKAGVAALMSAYTAGVERAIADHVAPSCTGKRPPNAGTTGIECNDAACPRHGTIRRTRT